MNDCTIKLISSTFTKDEYGVPRPSETAKEVFAQMHSITRQEFFDGGRSGLNPQYEFTVFRGDYNGELIIDFNNDRYAVYRTYIADSDYIELYVERKGGVNATVTSGGS